MTTEPTITINGQTLSVGEAMTVRVAVESFASDLCAKPNPLGNDMHGKQMTAGYLAKIDNIRRMIFQS